jgi:hypothetical protein
MYGAVHLHLLETSKLHEGCLTRWRSSCKLNLRGTWLLGFHDRRIRPAGITFTARTCRLHLRSGFHDPTNWASVQKYPAPWARGPLGQRGFRQSPFCPAQDITCVEPLRSQRGAWRRHSLGRATLAFVCLCASFQSLQPRLLAVWFSPQLQLLSYCFVVTHFPHLCSVMLRVSMVLAVFAL